MHPCQEFWGTDLAYGSLVTDEPLRRNERVCPAPELFVVDLAGQEGAPGAEDGLASLVRRACGFDGRAETLRQSASCLRDYLKSASRAAGASVPRILGIASVHRAPGARRGGDADPAPADPRPEDADPASVQLCNALLERLAALGRTRGVAQIDWIVVRGDDAQAASRAPLGTARVQRLQVHPLQP